MAKEEEQSSKGRGKVWWIWLIVLCTLGAAISYVDRTNMGIAIVPMASDFHWTTSQQGLVLGAFFLGYLLTQALGGWLADASVFGPHSGFVVLAMGEAAWSLFTVLTPLAAKWGLPWLVLARVLLGVGEGIGYPAIHSLIGKMVPRKYMNGAIASTCGGCYVGGVIALLASSPIAASEVLGWEYIFYIFGSVGALWLIPWIALWICAPPTSCNQSSDGDKLKCWRVFFTTKRVWVLLVTSFCNGWGFWVFMSWMPTFFKAKFGTELHDLGFYSFFPYLVQGVLSFVFGFFGDWILNRQFMALRTLRVGSQVMAMWGSGLFLMLAALTASNIYTGALHFTLSLGILALSTLGVNIAHLDLAPNHAGSLFGLLNSASVLSGVIGVPLSGLVLDWTGDNWTAVFALTSCIYFIGSIIWICMADLTPLDFDPTPPSIESEPTKSNVVVKEEETK